MNRYEERKQARIDYYNAQAAKASQRSSALAHESVDMISVIPPGQPILVGHHSETRHRNHLKRADNKMRKSVEEADKADYYANKAEAAESNTAISSDDPEAVTKLEAKLAALEAEQSDMKKVNAYWRKHRTMHGYPGLSVEEATQIDEGMKTAYSWVQKNGPCESWKLQNNNANMRRIRQRIETLKKVRALPEDSGWVFDGGRVEMNTEYNRIQVFFDTKPSEEIRKELKRWGFKWAPSLGVWQRHLNGNGMYAVKQVKFIQPIGVMQT